MKKILLTFLTALLLLSVLSCCALAADEEASYVTDISGLLTYEEWEELESMAQDISSRNDCGVYIVIVDDYNDYGSGDAYDAASQIFSHPDNGFGVGADRNGILMLLSMNEHDWAMYVHGKTAKYAFDDYGLSMLEDSFLPEFGDYDWYGGFSGYLSTCDDYLTQAASGNPVRESPVESILIVVGVSCLIALLVCLVLKGKMKSVRRKVEAQAYITAGGLCLTDSYDQFTHTTETRRRIERNTSKSESSGRSGKF